MYVENTPKAGEGTCVLYLDQIDGSSEVINFVNFDFSLNCMYFSCNEMAFRQINAIGVANLCN